VAAPVLEIYGSTETGAVATRRTAREARWKPLPDVLLAPSEDGCDAWGSHFRSPQRLADRIAIDADGTFELLGRQADLIKVAGRRASLAGLNQLLQQLPGLSDGVFYLPATELPTERLVLIHVRESPERSAIEAWLRERMDPVFLPRAFIAVDRLPRSSSGKLPRAALDDIYEAWRAKEHGHRTP
jgi:acyl-coenzyme A synthetase/AMP-(fatty) acid ligase